MVKYPLVNSDTQLNNQLRKSKRKLRSHVSARVWGYMQTYNKKRDGKDNGLAM